MLFVLRKKMRSTSARGADRLAGVDFKILLKCRYDFDFRLVHKKVEEEFLCWDGDASWRNLYYDSYFHIVQSSGMRKTKLTYEAWRMSTIGARSRSKDVI